MEAVIYSQIKMDFTPATVNHPANVQRLKGQNKSLYDWLAAGNTISIFSPAMKSLGIGYLNSRISDLRNKCKIQIYDRLIDVNGTKCNEYSLKPFEK
jgi:hypothetical protein